MLLILRSESLENQKDEDGNLLLNKESLYFQQDGAPPHYVRQWLNNRFPEMDR